MADSSRSAWPFLCRLGIHRLGWTGLHAMNDGKLYRCERKGCTLKVWRAR